MVSPALSLRTFRSEDGPCRRSPSNPADPASEEVHSVIEDVRDMTTPLSEFAEHFTNEDHVDYEGPFLTTSVRNT